MLFSKQIIGNSRAAQEQWKDVVGNRNAYAVNEQELAAKKRAAGFQVNEGLIPQDVYQEFDNVTVEQMRLDDGDAFLNDLLPLSTSVSIGKLVHKFRQASNAGNVQTSMSGQDGVTFDNVDYSYDGTIIPIHNAGFGRNWREFNAQSSEDFDALIDDQRETVASVRQHAADQFLSGHVDKNGNAIVVDGLSWTGMRNDSRVAQVTLTFDFTDATKTGKEIKAAFISEIRNVMSITNKCGFDLVYYVSPEIASVFEQQFSENYPNRLVQQELESLNFVDTIKVTNKLSGNEIMGFPLNGRVRPVVGMGINTVAMPRPMYNSNYNFVTWGAIGFQVREDFAGNTCAIFAT